ncbi:hypothetical protein DTJ15_08955 [Parasaccharibacter sp. TMW 2.1891]|nr:hypothetical protein [Parasaccharibacter sp. TMW 2.1891]
MMAPPCCWRDGVAESRRSPRAGEEWEEEGDVSMNVSDLPARQPGWQWHSNGEGDGKQGGGASVLSSCFCT